jgi:serine protease DegQ
MRATRRILFCLLLGLLASGCAWVGGRQGAGPIGIPETACCGGAYPTLAPLVRAITPAVVNISVTSTVALEEHALFNDPEFRRFLKRFGLPLPRTPREGRRQSVGSGFVFDADRGYVVTNRHVVQDADQITVTLKDRSTYRARLVGSDAGADIAVLQLSPVPVGLQALRFGNSDDLQVGDYVLAIGNPFGIGQTVTSGIVSALGRTGVGGDGLQDLIQTDASINPGNSGGPLINLGGQVVGIDIALLGPSGSNVGIGFATPSKLVEAAIQRVVTHR